MGYELVLMSNRYMKRKNLKPPFTWFGGKTVHAKKFLPFIPEHSHYCEVFGGSGALLIAKPKAPFEVYNDLDDGLVNFFYVLGHEELFPQFYKRVRLTSHSRSDFYWARNTWQEQEDPVEKALRWFIVARQSFSGKFGVSWSYSTGNITRGMPQKVSAYRSAIDSMKALHQRLKNVTIECNDWQLVCKAHNCPEMVFYLDPPYVHSTRTDIRYDNEIQDSDHKDMIKFLLDDLKGRALVSGYRNDIYKELEEAGWNTIDFNVASYATPHSAVTGTKGKSRPRRIETLWFNYEVEGI